MAHSSTRENGRRLSSRDTWFYKFILGPLFLIAFLAGTLATAIQRNSMVFAMVAVTCAVLYLQKRMLWPLKTVSAYADCLEIGNFFRTVRVPYRDIADISELPLNYRPTTITLKKSCPFGRKIMFVPYGMFQMPFVTKWEPHPAKTFIEGKIREAAGGANSVADAKDLPAGERVQLSSSGILFQKYIAGIVAVVGPGIWLAMTPIQLESWPYFWVPMTAALLWVAKTNFWPLKAVVACESHLEVSGATGCVQIPYENIERIVETPYLGRSTRLLLKQPCELGSEILYRPYSVPTLSFWSRQWHPANVLIESRMRVAQAKSAGRDQG